MKTRTAGGPRPAFPFPSTTDLRHLDPRRWLPRSSPRCRSRSRHSVALDFAPVPVASSHGRRPRRYAEAPRDPQLPHYRADVRPRRGCAAIPEIIPIPAARITRGARPRRARCRRRTSSSRSRCSASGSAAGHAEARGGADRHRIPRRAVPPYELHLAVPRPRGGRMESVRRGFQFKSRILGWPRRCSSTTRCSGSSAPSSGARRELYTLER